MGKKLAKQFRFKKFKIVIKKFRFKLLGKINPWVLLADGKIEEVKTKGGVNVGSSGKFVIKAGDDVDGVLIGSWSKKSKYVEHVEGMNINARKTEYNDLLIDGKKRINGVDTFDYDKAVKELGQDSADAIRGRGKLANSLGKSPSPQHNAHHIIPVEVLEKNPIMRKALEGGFEFYSDVNGMWLKL